MASVENMVTVADLMSEIGPAVWVTQSLHDAAEHLNQGQMAVVVVNLSYRPVGLITAEDLKTVAFKEPGSWQKKRCAGLAHDRQDRLSVDDSVDTALRHFQHAGCGSVLVLDGETAVGVLHSTAVQPYERAGSEITKTHTADHRHPEPPR